MRTGASAFIAKTVTVQWQPRLRYYLREMARGQLRLVIKVLSLPRDARQLTSAARFALRNSAIAAASEQL